MRHLILNTLFFLVGIVFCSGQEMNSMDEDTAAFVKKEHTVSFGIRVGYGVSNITYTGYFPTRFSYKSCPQMGVSAEVKIIKLLYFQSELLYTNTGNTLFKIDQNGNKTTDSTFNMHCLQLPLQAKVKVGKKFKGYYMTGLAPSLLLGANLKYKIDSMTTRANYTEYENRFTINLMNTIGLEIDIDESITPYIDFRYTQGLTTLDKPSSPYSSNKRLLNQQFVCSVGVRF